MTNAESDLWLELTVTAPTARLAERVTDLLIGRGIENVVEQDPGTLDGQDLAPDERRLVVYLEGEREDFARSLVGELEGLDEGLVVGLHPFTDTSWRDGWKAFFRPARVSPRLAVRAPWAELEVPPGVETLIIEPGMAFGTGMHETTRLCMEVLDRVLATDCAGATRMLDVGCGSGVLAIAAARLGVTQCQGLDIDPVGVEVSDENAHQNGVGAACRFSTTSLDALDGEWPLVVANILFHTLLELREGLVARTAPGGRLIVSGLLVTEAEQLAETFCELSDLRLVRRQSLGLWACLEFVRGGGEEPSA